MFTMCLLWVRIHFFILVLNMLNYVAVHIVARRVANKLFNY